MSVSSMGSGSNLSLPGLSGYDFSGIVTNLVQAYKAPETQMQSAVSDLQTKKNAWMDINTRMAALEKTLSGLSDSTTWTATTATSSNTSLLSATGGSGASQGAYTINVNQLAYAQTVASDVQNVASATTPLTQIVNGGSFTITVGGDPTTTKTVKVGANASLTDIAGAINNAQAGVTATVLKVTNGYQMSITDTKSGLANIVSLAYVTGSGDNVVNALGITGSNPFATSKTYTNQTSVVSGLKGTFQVIIGKDSAKPQTMTVDLGSTDLNLTDAATKINAANAGVTASVIAANGGFQLQLANNQLGTDQASTLTYNANDALNVLGATSTSDVTLGNTFSHKTQSAVDAQLSINGVSGITSSTNTITDAIPGVTLNLLGQTNATTGPITLNVAADYSQAQNAVKSFVDQYNSTMDFISTKIGTYDSNLGKATGDLFGDPMLESIQYQLRDMVTGFLNNPTGPYNSLSSIGVSTSSADYSSDNNFGQSAQLTFDTTKFNQAMTDNPQSVANLLGASFGGVSPITTTTGTSSAQGLANVMEEYLNPLVMYQGTLTQTQNDLGQQITDLNKDISDFDERAKNYEAQVKLQYSTLETTLAGLNGQSSWLTAQVNSMSGTSSSSK